MALVFLINSDAVPSRSYSLVYVSNSLTVGLAILGLPLTGFLPNDQGPFFLVFSFMQYWSIPLSLITA